MDSYKTDGVRPSHVNVLLDVVNQLFQTHLKWKKERLHRLGTSELITLFVPTNQ